jgi:hypothetical protein
MTATAHVFTSYGFAIAVDGRQRWAHAPSRDRHVIQLESDKVQKLFEVAGKQMRFAYTVKGHIASVDRSFDLRVELNRQIENLRDKRFRNCRSFVETLAAGIEQVIKDALVQRRLEGYPAAEICFAGYFKGKPYCLDVQFRRYLNQYGHLWGITEYEVKPGLCIVSGSAVVKSLIENKDPRMKDFYVPLDDQTSLEGASKFVTGYIRACCSDWALELDPSCKGIGGHVHVATVTPPEPIKAKILRFFGLGSRQKTGFQWVIPPAPRESSI